MIDFDKNKHLAEKITALLKCDARISQETLRFINSTFNHPSVEQLCRILSDTDSCDSLTVCELLLFPDETIHILFEPDLGKNEYTQSDLDEICRMACREKLCARFVFPDDRETFRVLLPESAVAKFIQRLNIINRIDGQIDQALTRCIQNPTDYLKARVWLRNRRFEFSESISDFLTGLISKSNPAHTVFWDALDYMMEFFNTFPSIQDIGSALIEKRRECFEILDLSEKNNKALQENAVEFLLMKGIRIASVCVEEIKKEIDLIDYIL